MNYSQDMFDDSPSDSSDIEIPSLEGEELSWRGVPLSDIKSKRPTYPIPVKPSANHQVLFKVPVYHGQTPVPFPQHPNDRWDTSHVRMPHSSRNLFPVSQSEVKSRWELIKDALGKSIRNTKDLEAAIFSYNLRMHQKISLAALHQFFSETLLPEESEFFFDNVLPGIIQLALSIENLVRGGLRLLQRNQSASVSLSQEQVGALLANAFLSSFPRRPGPSNYPNINFLRLFQCGSMPSVQEKLKCFVNYFRRICNKRPTGVVTYSRRYVEPRKLPAWPDLDLTLPPLYISSEGTIEKEGAGLLEIDFANKLVGGGVLGRGSVQEEIKFLICPELVLARLFTESLNDTEALIVTGCEQFNSHEGYGSTFEWSGNVEDSSERDEWGRRRTAVAAIDATYFSDPSNQYQEEALRRELNKAYVGFSAWRGGSVATGNWGCGVFQGDARLKALLQLMAAASARVSVAYFTFGDRQLAKDIHSVWLTLTQNNISIGQLWKTLAAYDTSRPLYDFVLSSLVPCSGLPEEIGCQNITKKMDDCRCREKEDEDPSFSKRKVGELKKSDNVDDKLVGKNSKDSEQEKLTEAGKSSIPKKDEQLPISKTAQKRRSMLSSSSSGELEESDSCSRSMENNEAKGQSTSKTPQKKRSILTSSSSSDLNESENSREPIVIDQAKGLDQVNARPGLRNPQLRENIQKNNTATAICPPDDFPISSSETKNNKLGEEGDQNKNQSIAGSTCSLNTPEGRANCLASEKIRWDTYRSTISCYSSTRPPLKRKISDYFQKVEK